LHIEDNSRSVAFFYKEWYFYAIRNISHYIIIIFLNSFMQQRGKSMIKKACFICALCATLIVSIQASTNKTKNVDAISGATLSTECAFTLPIKVTTRSATIEWAEWFADQGTATISYGLTAANLTTRPVTGLERSYSKLELTELLPNTSYFVFLKVTSTEHDPYGDTATIKTMDPSQALQQFVSSKNVPLEMLDHSVKLGSQARPGDRLAMTDCNGRTIFNHVVSASEGIIGLPSAAKGAYFLTYYRQGKLLDKKLFIQTSK
jgi:hypothetical protein